MASLFRASSVWLVACLLWPLWNRSRWWWRCVVELITQVSVRHPPPPSPGCDESECAGCDVSDGPTEFSSACPVCLVHSVSVRMCWRFLVQTCFLDAVQYLSVLNARLWNSSLHLIWFRRCEWIAYFAASNSSVACCSCYA